MMEQLEHLAGLIYAYCTDFVINLANLLDLSYYDLNALIFCVIWPLVTVLLIVMNLVSWVKLKNVR